MGGNEQAGGGIAMHDHLFQFSSHSTLSQWLRSLAERFTASL